MKKGEVPGVDFSSGEWYYVFERVVRATREMVWHASAVLVVNVS